MISELFTVYLIHVKWFLNYLQFTWLDIYITTHIMYHMTNDHVSRLKKAPQHKPPLPPTWTSILARTYHVQNLARQIHYFIPLSSFFKQLVWWFATVYIQPSRNECSRERKRTAQPSGRRQKKTPPPPKVSSQRSRPWATPWPWSWPSRSRRKSPQTPPSTKTASSRWT